ncbi:lipopolysaccharide export system protein LptA [Pacificibacter maritimus]|uniref:Lipopolysaccharide export system protein LptA n=1 Tax=Pacificibacter maritimus TaxID=762213 RepID=A0A3N4U4D3_9RHOB|nr:lipopolysaccharide transport periplasmic protein LptA [Pacificibacter maritimus]RPE64658.1 lipopolysaccharide export system protein LptA [Pacificibacter maritimus]
MQQLKRLKNIAIFTLAAAAFSTSLAAQDTQVAFGGLQHDSGLPVEISSDELSVDQSTGKAIFSGSVLIGQGALRLSADTVEVVYNADDSGKIDELIATGSVTFANGNEAIEADRATYSIDTSTIALAGNVILTQGRNVLSGQQMTVDLTTGTGRINGRVKTILQTGAE